MSQFSILESEFSAVFDHARRAETLVLSDPRGACFYARLALETAVKWMYKYENALHSPYDNALSALIFEPTFRNLVGNSLVTKAKIVKDLGNRAVHDTRKITPQSAVTSVRELFHFSYWLVRTYARGEKPDPGLQFSPQVLPQTKTIEVKTLVAYQQAAKQYKEKMRQLEEADTARIQTDEQAKALEEELKLLKAEIAKIRKANETTSDTHDYNETQTRDAFIDLLLHEAGWPLDQERDREFPVTGMPNSTGEGRVDYVLWGDDGKPLALIEAKRTRRDARVGQQQAKLYADCLETKFGRRPVILYTNGYEHWLWDDVGYPPRPVQGFLKKDELMLLHQRHGTRKLLSRIDIDTNTVERPYQTRAIRRIGEAFEKDKLRKVLLVMATGSGKTRTVIALIDQLMRANWVKRALFLADRVALVNQAVGAFKTHLPHVAPVNLVKNKETEGRVYVSTYPTMVGLIDEMQNGVRRYGPGHFDLIVIDEAHRSVYRKYKAIFGYFDSLLVGLTATPRDEIDRDTYGLFELERGVPTDSYDLDEAVDDGYLVPPRAVSVPLKFQREGINYDDLSEEEKEAWDALEWTEDGEVPDRVDAAALNKWLFNADTVDKVLEHVMTHGLKVEEGDRLGKTIIFAKNHKHAVFIQERFDKNYPHLKGHFARVIDFKTEYAQSLIDDFSDLGKAPHIAISVDMLDTGIDVPEVVNLVFFKIVRSKTKFWQMIGRGTRLCPDLFGPGRHKEHFLVFDFCQNFEFFNQNPNMIEGSIGPSLGEKLFISRIDLMGEIDQIGIETDDEALIEFRKNIEARLFDEVSAMSIDNFIVRPKRKFVDKFQERVAWQNLTPEDRTELAEHLAGLPSAYKDDDLAAKQFDYLILQYQLAILRSDPSFASLQARIMSIASKLEELGNVPMVAAEMPLILEVQTDEYWQDINLPILEVLRRHLRKLVKLIEPDARKIVYTDFEDEIGVATDVDLPSVGTGTDKARFLMKVRHFLAQHVDHISIQKLRRDKQLTTHDLAELERIFLEEAVVTAEDLERIRVDGGLGLLIRSLVGLDRKAAKGVLAEFMDSRSLTANQIEFINLIIDHLTERGIMDPRRLYESPFTDFDDQGVSGVFPDADVKQLVQLLINVKERAAA
ncbi:MAG: DEAD/DEAH box helicase family protein [Bacteroidetes Order II. Incertae sedis bacterium]|nr:DEAD/DEAH box helicase family protein [Bacteroidetes Order II. bacterium]